MPWNIIIISGGQAGADRAALDFAIRNNIPHGGWCPKGRVAQDGPLDAQYKLKETPSEEPLERTQWNVRDSDATVVLTLGPKATGGTLKALQAAKKLKKPWIHLHRGILGTSEKLIAFTGKHAVKRLNVAGSQEIEEPGIYAWTGDLLQKIYREVEMREASY